ncbi:S1-like domain-containing RNA-binding protein [uncultured Desulfuromusa sp.]|uniref:CvfB family protein n=1 Tax=uncultured Desulfuromusa sp. TaxID=219183 RepID=UPI002AA62919|nr:S1-like domain-containing RNA-binding protein [uncultured Desulfuromusa sp.]
MLLPGYRYALKIKSIEPEGAWLNSQEEQFFLPRRECPGEINEGETVEVFLYLDRNNEKKITTQMPFAQVGEFAMLNVQSIGPHGAFLDWGIEKDLLAPYSEQAQKMVEGRSYLVHIFHDHENRPIASSRLERFLVKENRDLREGEEVELLIWAFTDLGAKVIVNNHYEALLYKDEIPVGLKRGELHRGYVLRIRADHRIDVTLRRPGVAGIQDARDVILDALKIEGFLPLHDQSPPELIRNQLGLSKKVFKKAVGGLYKDGLVELTGRGIKIQAK